MLDRNLVYKSLKFSLTKIAGNDTIKLFSIKKGDPFDVDCFIKIDELTQSGIKNNINSNLKININDNGNCKIENSKSEFGNYGSLIVTDTGEFLNVYYFLDGNSKKKLVDTTGNIDIRFNINFGNIILDIISCQRPTSGIIFEYNQVDGITDISNDVTYFRNDVYFERFQVGNMIADQNGLSAGTGKTMIKENGEIFTDNADNITLGDKSLTNFIRNLIESEYKYEGEFNPGDDELESTNLDLTGIE